MTTPADWYPDPENPGQLRYWDGAIWTEHRAPAPVPAEVPASEQATSVVSLPHEPAPDAPAEPAEPSFVTPAWDPPPGMSYDDAVATPSWNAPLAGQSYMAPQFAPPPGPPGPPAPPTGGPGPNKKLIIGILSGAAALILILALALVYVFVIRDDSTTVTASSSASSSTKKATSSRTSTTESETTAKESPSRESAGPVTDGNLSFTITDIEAAESVTSTFSDQVGKTAQGTYAIVHLTVGNVGVEPVTFLATFQRLNGSGQGLVPDDEATVFAGGGYADVPPGSEVETVVVFDVPDDVEPESMFFQENPVTPGVELPF